MNMINETTLNQEKLEKSQYGFLKFLSFEGWIGLIATLMFVPFMVWNFFKTGEEPYMKLVCDLAQAISSGLMFINAWHVSKSKLLDEKTQAAWRKVTIAFFSYFCGQALWFYLDAILGEPPFPSVADIGYTLFYPLMLWALRSFPTAPQSKAEKQKFWLDASIVMVSGLVVVWYFIINPTIESGNEPLKIVLNLIYVIGDMILFLGIITILLKQPLEISRRALYAIILGLIAIAIADINFASYTLQNISPTGAWFDSFFTVSSYFMILAALIQRKCSVKCANAQMDNSVFPHSKFSWLPYIAIIVGYIMLLIVSQPYWSEPVGIFIFAAFVITGLVVVRQVSAVKENIRLVEESMVEQSEKRLRSLLENSSDITKIIDDKGNFVYISPTIEREFGYSIEKLLGTGVFDFIHFEDAKTIMNAYKENVNNYDVKIKLEYRFKRSDGTWRVLEGVGQNVFDEKTQKCLVLVNALDVTERKEQEYRLNEYTKKLQQSNRELQDFAFVASHDLQEPLRKVQAFGDRLERKFSDKLGEDGLDYLSRMQSASKRMQTLITDLLTFSRVTTKAKPFEHSDLNIILQEVLSDLEVKIEETKAEIKIKELPQMDVDKTQMRQLFQNLIGNALKFSKSENSPIIKIYSESNETEADDAQHKTSVDLSNPESIIPPGYCRIFVKDNGIGFDEKYIDKIFTVFQRLHGRTEYEGSGVGLAVCRKIVERHNGNLTAKSTAGEGSTFIITLPLKQSQNGGEYDLKTTNNPIG